jgi:hypothetical protein|tara:strand:+ start:157 stop:1539 length:1383 start_codon:yes stop_codon:yes gene_type:complete
MSEMDTVWSPQPGPQEAAIRAAFVDEMFYGGAAGGGKSDFLLGDFLMDLGQGSDWQGIIFRQSYPALEELVQRSTELYPKTGGDYKVGKSQWEWPNGAILKFRHMENVFDFIKYQGHSYSWIAFDELPEWADMACWNRMKSRLRGKAQNKRMRGTGNPGGIGHAAIQEYFQIPTSPMTYKDARPTQDPDTLMWRVFIPSRVQDNKILMDFDPQYVHRLAGVGDPELVKAWLEGDWSALVGAYFSQNWNKVDLVESFDIPEEWPILTGMDYGEESPTCCLWAAKDFDGNLIIFNEYYAKGASASQHALAVKSTQDDCPHSQREPTYHIVDPNFFVRRRLDEAPLNAAADFFAVEGLHLTKGNNNRVNGWRVLNDAMSKGKLKIFKEWCPNLIRTLPAVPRDLKKPEDINTDSEDHAVDSLRYLAVHVFGATKAKELAEASDGKAIIDSLKAMGKGRNGRYG